MNGICLGFGIGFLIDGLIYFIFSSKKLTHIIDKNINQSELERSCRRCRIGGLVYSISGICLLLTFFVIHFSKTGA